VRQGDAAAFRQRERSFRRLLEQVKGELISG